MLYTLFVLFTGIYLGQEVSVIPSIKIIVGNIMLYLNELPDPEENEYYNDNEEGWIQLIRGYLFW